MARSLYSLYVISVKKHLTFMIRYQEWNSCKQNTQEVKKVKYSVLAGKDLFHEILSLHPILKCNILTSW